MNNDMQGVLISIQPKWVEKILSGEKTVEVRKSKPRLEVPFKCYVYETIGKKSYLGKIEENKIYGQEGKGKVVAEFTCEVVLPISIMYSDPSNRIALREFPYTSLTDKQIMDYLGNGTTGYGWHISDLVIYDKPKELSDFYVERVTTTDYPKLTKLTKPPQSWCYVERG